MVASTKFGHTMSLHVDGQKPEHGLGYPESHRAEVGARRDLWNSFTQETCPHTAILDGAKCQLCGNTYVITDLS